MQYTLNQLRIFLTITQMGSITKAAEELHLTQPAVSIQLKNFQEQFDMPLTEVVGRQLYITEFGREVAKTTEQILDGINELNYKAHAHSGHLTGRLKISIVSTGKYVMPYFLADFLSDNPGVELKMDVTNRAMVLESLEKNEVDFSLVSILPENIAVEHIPLMQNKLFLIAGRKHDFKKKSYNDSVFKELPLIYREDGSGTRLVMERFFHDNEIPVLKKLELTSNEAVKQAVIAGLGCSIMPIIGIKNELNNGDLQIVRVKNLPLITNWYLTWMRGKRFSPVANDFLYYVEKHKEAIIECKFDWFEKY